MLPSGVASNFSRTAMNSLTNRDRPPIFTIGYGPRSFEEFARLLKEYDIEFLLDVRSSPSSDREAYMKENLRDRLTEVGITYSYFGDLLGGRPEDNDCYHNGLVIYNRCRKKDWFRRGIDRLKTAQEGNHRVALMCSEIRPEKCHRSKMIGVGLQDEGIEVMHIDERDMLSRQEDVLKRLDSNMQDLFDDAPDLGYTSRKAYR